MTTVFVLYTEMLSTVSIEHLFSNDNFKSQVKNETGKQRNLYSPSVKAYK